MVKTPLSHFLFLPIVHKALFLHDTIECSFCRFCMISIKHTPNKPNNTNHTNNPIILIPLLYNPDKSFIFRTHDPFSPNASRRFLGEIIAHIHTQIHTHYLQHTRPTFAKRYTRVLFLCMCVFVYACVWKEKGNKL